ncbi:MAG: HAD hydrolase-like protein [Verrucomicrobiales bacterium]
MPSRELLLLFDIDGTLLDTGGAGISALGTALRRTFLPGAPIPALDLAGSTDSGIIKSLFAHFGIPETTTNAAAFYEAYLVALQENLHAPDSSGRLLPGIAPLLEVLDSETSHVSALLTGNIRRGAFLKVAHYGIGHHFETGAFGDDHHDRDRLGPVALERAQRHHGQSFEAHDTVIIGDTPKDIRCARAFGARVVAVATGNFSRTELEAHQPDHVLDHFEDTAEVIAALEGK